MKINISKDFRPKYKTKLLRVGRNNDGGYLIPKDAINETKILYSMGLSDDWSFEESLFNLKNDIKIFSYDKSVNYKFWLKNFIINLINFVKLNNNFKIFLKNTLSYFKYRIFFGKPNIIHIKKNIEEKKVYNILGQDYSKSIDEILQENGNNNFSMKIDIEGNEYRILDDIILNQKGLEFLVIEFHNIDLMENHIKSFLQNLSLDLVHIHVNNFGGINKNGHAKVIEFTFSKRKYNFLRNNNEFRFPESIDQPNNPNIEDMQVYFVD